MNKKTRISILFSSILFLSGISLNAQSAGKQTDSGGKAEAIAQQAKEDIANADNKVRKQDYDEAISIIQKTYDSLSAHKDILEDFYGNIIFKPDTLLVKMARIYLMQNRLEEAAKQIDAYFNLHTVKIDLQILLLKANVSYQLQKFPESIAAYTDILERDRLSDSLRFACFFRRGVSFYNQEEIESAFIDFMASSKIYPNRHEPYFNMGRCLFKEKVTRENLLRAIGYFTKTLSIDSLHIPALFLRGLSYERLKKYTLAALDFSKCIDIDPEDEDAYYKKAYMLYLLNKSRVSPSICEEFFRAVRLGSGKALLFYEEYCKKEKELSP